MIVYIQCDIKTGTIVEYIHEQITKDDNSIKASVLETIKNKTEHFEQENSFRGMFCCTVHFHVSDSIRRGTRADQARSS